MNCLTTFNVTWLRRSRCWLNISLVKLRSKAFSIHQSTVFHMNNPLETKKWLIQYHIPERTQITCWICSTLSSSSMKNWRYGKETSISQLPPLARCSSIECCPPLNACLLIYCKRTVSNPFRIQSKLTFVLISLRESVRKMDEVGCDANIFDFKPCSAGKKVECSNAGFGKFKHGATSRVNRKDGSYSWSI